MPNSPAYPPELRAAISDLIYIEANHSLAKLDGELLIEALSEAAWRVLLEYVAAMGRAHKAGIPTPWSGL